MRAEFLHGVPVASAAERRVDVVPFLNRGGKGIEIFSGMRRQEPDRHGAEEAGQDHSWREARRVAYVWDLSQTTGQPVPLPPAFRHPGRACFRQPADVGGHLTGNRHARQDLRRDAT
jgi:hypothetical protein